MRISIALRRAIERHHLSPFLLARQARIGHSTLSKFLSGKAGIGLAGLDRLCLVMGLRLVQGEPWKPSADGAVGEETEKTTPTRPTLAGGR